MNDSRSELWLQITAGKGPEECAWAVVRVLEKVCAEAAAAGLETKTIEVEPGPQAGTALSALIAFSGPEKLTTFANSWRGTVQWIARSPFRPELKRKNWFRGSTFQSERSAVGNHARQRTRRSARESNRVRGSCDAFADAASGFRHGRALATSQPQTRLGAFGAEVGRTRR
jgi:hypothetical protein